MRKYQVIMVYCRQKNEESCRICPCLLSWLSSYELEQLMRRSLWDTLYDTFGDKLKTNVPLFHNNVCVLVREVYVLM